MTCISAFRSPLKLAEKHINCVSKRPNAIEIVQPSFRAVESSGPEDPMNFSMSKKYAEISFDSVSSFVCIYFIYLGIYISFKFTYGGIIPSHQGLITSHYKIYKLSYINQPVFHGTYGISSCQPKGV